MRKTIQSLTLLAFVAGSAVSALAQSMPTTQPKFLHIVREKVKMGRTAEHSKWEAGWPAAFEKAKSPYTYLGLVSITGPAEAWYLIPFASQAAYGESLGFEAANAALSAELDRLSKGDAEFVSEADALQAIARPELSHGGYPDLATMRFWDIGTFQVKPGHDEEFAAAIKAYAAAAKRAAPNASWRTYQVVAGAPGGTYLFFSSFASFGELDKVFEEDEATFKAFTYDERSAMQKLMAEGTVTSWSNRFRLDPAQSYVPAEVRQKDPGFWMPKPPPAKATAKKP
jgi:hypothetical protein